MWFICLSNDIQAKRFENVLVLHWQMGIRQFFIGSGQLIYLQESVKKPLLWCYFG